MRNFFQAARFLSNLKYKNAFVTLQNQQKRSIGFRSAPPVPELCEATQPSEEVYNGTGSLEEFLNIRFGPNMPTILDDKNPTRDLVNFPRQVRKDFPEPCRLGIIPESWFQMFYEKTGVTGPYCFLYGFLTFLLSKEWLVVEHELLVGIEATIIIVALTKMYAPSIREKMGKEIDEIEQSWEDWQKGMIKFLNDYIKIEEMIRDSPQHHMILFDAKRENVHLQLEAEYRRRQMQVYNEVRRRLEYLVAKEEAEKQFQQKHMVNWIIQNVAKSITPAQEKDALKTTLVELKRLSSNVKL